MSFSSLVFAFKIVFIESDVNNMNQERIGRFIAKCRKEKGLTQEELAEKLNVSNKSVSRWETGVTLPSLNTFVLLSKIFDVTINDLISGEIVVKESYQDKFEENIVQVVAKIDKKASFNRLLFQFLIGFTLFLTILTGYVFLKDVTVKREYNPDWIRIEEQNDVIFLYSSIPGREERYSDLYNDGEEEYVVIFFTIRTPWYEYVLGRRSGGGSGMKLSGWVDQWKLEDKIEKIDNGEIGVKFYYTTVDFNEIRGADNTKLKEVMDKSYLMYEVEKNSLEEENR